MAFSSEAALMCSSHDWIMSAVKSLGGSVASRAAVSSFRPFIRVPISATTSAGREPFARFCIRASYWACFSSMRFFRAGIGIVLTGIFAGRGANYVSDLVRKMRDIGGEG